MSSAASCGTVDTSTRTHMAKGAPTCSSSSWSTFAKVLGELVVSSLVGFVAALASHHRSVMNAMFAHEFTGTDIERQQSLSAVVMNASSFSNFIQDVLAQRCTELSVLKQLPSRPSHLWRISPASSTSGRVREQVFCVLNRLGALGNCCNRFNIFGINGIDAAPFDSSHTAHCVPVLIRVSFVRNEKTHKDQNTQSGAEHLFFFFFLIVFH